MPEMDFSGSEEVTYVRDNFFGNASIISNMIDAHIDVTHFIDESKGNWK